MRLLLDACIGRSTLQRLRDLGHDVARIGDDEPDPGDEAILSRAVREERVLVTADKDFGELIYRRGHRHSGMLRLHQMPLPSQADLVTETLDRYGPELRAGAFVIVQRDRTRVRPPAP